MSETINLGKLIVQLGLDKVALQKGTEETVQGLKGLERTSEQTRNALKKAFAAETLVASANRVGGALGQLGGDFGKLAQQATTGLGAIAQGFFQGGALGAGLAAGAVGFSVLIGKIAEAEEAGKRLVKVIGDDIARAAERTRTFSIRGLDAGNTLADVAFARANKTSLGDAAFARRAQALVGRLGSSDPSIAADARSELETITREREAAKALEEFNKEAEKTAKTVKVATQALSIFNTDGQSAYSLALADFNARAAGKTSGGYMNLSAAERARVDAAAAARGEGGLVDTGATPRAAILRGNIDTFDGVEMWADEAEALRQSVTGATYAASLLPPAFQGLGAELPKIVSEVGKLGGSFDGLFTGEIGTSLLNAGIAFLAQSKTFKRAQELAGGALQAAADGIGRVLEPALPGIVLLTKVAEKFFGAFGDVLSFLAGPIGMVIYNSVSGIALIWNGIASITTMVLDQISGFYTAIGLGETDGAKGLAKFNESLKASQVSIPPFNEAMKDVTGEAGAEADTKKELNKALQQELNNLPAGYRYALGAYRAQDAAGAAPAGAMAGRGSAPSIVNYIYTDSPDTLARRTGQHNRRMAYGRRGSSQTGRSEYAGSSSSAGDV
jgi:hypothetical protein